MLICEIDQVFMAESAAASKNWRLEREEFLERAALEKELLQHEIAERESGFGELTQAALKAGADPANVDMIVTSTEGNMRVTDGGFRGRYYRAYARHGDRMDGSRGYSRR